MVSYFRLLAIIFFALACKTVSRTSTNFATVSACKSLKKGFYAEMQAAELSPEDEFMQTSFLSYCRDYLLDKRVGDPALEPKMWTLDHGAALQVAAYAKADYPLPYVRTFLYRQVGDCQLGMRVFAADPTKLAGKKPFIFIHGGGWQIRQFTATLGVSSVIPIFAKHDYVVFSPVYRLLSKSSGLAACQGAVGKDIEADIKAAFAWVEEKAKEMGLVGKIGVGGQSAGAHLALYLLTEHPQRISRSLLFYPVTDFSYMIDEIQAGRLSEYAKAPYLPNYFGKKGFPDLDSKHEQAVRNSFPAIIKKDPAKYPPIHLLHGTADTVVPVANALQLCQAYNHPTEDGGEVKGEVRVYRCGSGKYYEFSGGEHMLDLRCFHKVFERVIPKSFLKSKLCAAGSPALSAAVNQAVMDFFSAD